MIVGKYEQAEAYLKEALDAAQLFPDYVEGVAYVMASTAEKNQTGIAVKSKNSDTW